MQREIKFRAWDKKDKLMYYDIQKGIKFNDLSHYEFDEFLGNPKGMGDYHEWEVMQYTGLKDKNGKEIYEGDIVEKYYMEDGERKKCFGSPRDIPDGKNEHLAVVKFGWGKFFADVSVGSSDITSVDIEIIGNIHENPELITKE